MLLQTTFKKISILSRMQTQMWFHRNINKYQKTRYSSKYHPKETSFLHYTYPFFSKKMVKSTQFHPSFYSPFTFYWPFELWSSSLLRTGWGFTLRTRGSSINSARDTWSSSTSGHVAIWEGSEPSIVEETYKWKQVLRGHERSHWNILKSWIGMTVLFPK